jgi:hypothetical protein
MAQPLLEAQIVPLFHDIAHIVPLFHGLVPLFTDPATLLGTASDTGHGQLGTDGSCSRATSARKHPQGRSAVAAELHAALDAINQGMAIQGVLTELKVGPTTANMLAQIQITGKIAIDIELLIDAGQPDVA